MIPLLVHLLVWHLTLTAPAYCSARAASCPLGCVDTTHSPQPCQQARTFRIYTQRQSPTWIAMHPAMLGDATVWAHFWPLVASEADYHLALEVPATPGLVSVAMPDSLAPGAWYFVVTVDDSARVSCMSNEVAR